MLQQPEVGMKVVWNGNENDTGTIVEVQSDKHPYRYIVVWGKGFNGNPSSRNSYSSLEVEESFISLAYDGDDGLKSYHQATIEKGEVGEISKIREEVEELIDADNQKNPVMALVELSDTIGAIELFLEKHHPSITLNDLITMAAATKRAFKSGARK